MGLLKRIECKKLQWPHERRVMPVMYINRKHVNLRQFRPYNKSLEPNKEVQFSMHKNPNRSPGLHLDNMPAAGQHDAIQRWIRQNNKDVGHPYGQSDPEPTQRAHFAHHQDPAIHEVSGGKLRKRRYNKILGLEGKLQHPQSAAGGRGKYDDADERAGGDRGRAG